MIDDMLGFFSECIPSLHLCLTAGPPFLLWSLACLGFAAYLRCERNVRVGYTRKVFHVLTFTTSVALQIRWGIDVLCLFGGAVSIVVFGAVCLGDGHPLFEALARPSDAPHRAYYVLVSYFATLAGGLAANLFFGNFAVVGYLVAGLGDACGEPAGARFGKHPYRFGTWPDSAPRRTLEGSLAVGLGSAVGILIATSLLQVPATPLVVAASLGLGTVSAFAEALAPHGWDNAVLQFLPAMLGWMIF